MFAGVAGYGVYLDAAVGVIEKKKFTDLVGFKIGGGRCPTYHVVVPSSLCLFLPAVIG